MKPNKPVATADAQPPSPDEELAEHIRHISAAWRKLKSGPLTRRAIVLLISDVSGEGKTAVTKILDSLGELEKQFLVPAKKSVSKGGRP
jgi:hypothetical protein